MKKSKWDRKDKKLQALSKKLESQKLLHVLDKNNNHKIWINMRVMLNELLQTIINWKQQITIFHMKQYNDLNWYCNDEETQHIYIWWTQIAW